MVDNNEICDPSILVEKHPNFYRAKLIINLLLKVNLNDVPVSELHDYLGLVDELLNEN